MRVYYNEFDKFAVAWLKQLIMFGAIPDGDIDERNITEVEAWELAAYDQCHFFAGIGGWAEAIRLAGWRGPIWTGSCPCQPFSVAGAQAGTADKRHLWPEFLRLIRVGRPPVVVGEQVASKLGREWLAGVRFDLEALGYAVGAADLCAAGVGSPHIRQRLYWVGQSQGQQQQHGRRDAGRGRRELADAGAPGGLQLTEGDGREQRRPEPRRRRSPVSRCAEGGGLAHGHGHGHEPGAGRGHAGEVCGISEAECEPELRAIIFGGSGRDDRGLPQSIGGERQRFADTDSGHHHHREAAKWYESNGLAQSCGDAGERLPNNNNNNTGLEITGVEPARGECAPAERSDAAGFWRGGVFVPCLDGKARRVEPGIFPLADGFPNRVGTLRGSGNAIVPQVAKEFLTAYMEATNDR